ncbi:MAG: hypothetical protein H6625_06360 [Bdellovibrionaceae bacterium]|nr:hypothetical protein [Pseudobdellovibrionaceae bacterium]
MAIEGLNSISINPINSSIPGKEKAAGVKGEFANQLDGLLKDNFSKTQELAKPLEIKFSNHAIERMRSRGIHFQPETLQRIDSAVNRASEKGAKETLVIAEDSALIVNIENKTVVTVMDKNMLKENIFTNIDAAVIV